MTHSKSPISTAITQSSLSVFLLPLLLKQPYSPHSTPAIARPARGADPRSRLRDGAAVTVAGRERGAVERGVGEIGGGDAVLFCFGIWLLLLFCG